MPYTNHKQLPEALVNAVQNRPYDWGLPDGVDPDQYITCTTLINPPQIDVLWRKHKDEIELDVSDEVWSLLGSSVHAILEWAAEPSDLSETRLYMPVLGWTLGGQLDSLTLKDGVLTDWKLTGCYKVVFDPNFEEWTKQLNVLAELCRHNGYTVNRIQVCTIYRDWSSWQAVRKKDYPRKQAETHELEMWENSQVQNYVESRVAAHAMARERGPKPCTDEERWRKPGKWRVEKQGRKTALRVLDSRETAEQWCADNGHAALTGEAVFSPKKGAAYLKVAGLAKGISIVEEPTRYRRCEDFCKVRSVCPQWLNQRPE